MVDRHSDRPPVGEGDRDLETREREVALREREHDIAQREHGLGGGAGSRHGDPARHERGPVAGDTHAGATHRGGTGLATAALVFGVLAILTLVLTLGGLFFIALPLGIVAIVLGSMAKKRAGGAGAPAPGRGRARAGSLLGWITTILSLLVVLLVAIGIAALGGLDGLQQEVEQQQQQLEPQDR